VIAASVVESALIPPPIVEPEPTSPIVATVATSALAEVPEAPVLMKSAIVGQCGSSTCPQPEGGRTQRACDGYSGGDRRQFHAAFSFDVPTRPRHSRLTESAIRQGATGRPQVVVVQRFLVTESHEPSM
jgi:hypothetical protein